MLSEIRITNFQNDRLLIPFESLFVASRLDIFLSSIRQSTTWEKTKIRTLITPIGLLGISGVTMKKVLFWKPPPQQVDKLGCSSRLIMASSRKQSASLNARLSSGMICNRSEMSSFQVGRLVCVFSVCVPWLQLSCLHRDPWRPHCKHLQPVAVWFEVQFRSIGSPGALLSAGRWTAQVVDVILLDLISSFECHPVVQLQTVLHLCLYLFCRRFAHLEMNNLLRLWLHVPLLAAQPLCL